METELRKRRFQKNNRSYRTYEEWKHYPHPVKRLSVKVLTVPMRNGNARIWATLSTFLISSYRTYEEWKPSSIDATRDTTSSCSYRTYEEWKHPAPHTRYKPYSSVLTVPMRNGNSEMDDSMIDLTGLFLPYL